MNWKSTETVSLVLSLCVAVAGVSCSGSSRPHNENESTGEHAAEAGHEEAGHEEGVVTLSAERIAAAKIRTTPAERRALAPELETTGEVGYEEERMAHVSPRISGRVVRANAGLGDEVRQGSVLAVIDSVELGQARAAYAAATTRADLASETYEREKGLYEQRVSSQREMLEAKAAYLEATTYRDSALETLRLYGQSGSDGPRLGDPGASLLNVLAPIAGRVVEKHVVVGELVNPERSMFTIADLGHVWVWIDVFERDLAAVHLGDGVEIRVDAHPKQSFAGEITYQSPQVAADTRTVRARIDVANPEGLLRPGMFAKVRLTDPHSESSDTSLVVPVAAVVRQAKAIFVFVPAGEGRFGVRPVETGREVGGFVEILSGLAAGDHVVSEGTFFLKSELAREELGEGHSH